MLTAWLVLVFFAGPVGVIAHYRRKDTHRTARIDQLETDLRNAYDAVVFAEAKTRQWADAFSTEHDARRRNWRCRDHPVWSTPR